MKKTSSIDQHQEAKWVCLKMRYIPNYSHLIGIMIMKTIGFRGLTYFQTHPNKIQGVTKNYYPSRWEPGSKKGLSPGEDHPVSDAAIFFAKSPFCHPYSYGRL